MPASSCIDNPQYRYRARGRKCCTHTRGPSSGTADGDGARHPARHAQNVPPGSGPGTAAAALRQSQLQSCRRRLSRRGGGGGVVGVVVLETVSGAPEDGVPPVGRVPTGGWTGRAGGGRLPLSLPLFLAVVAVVVVIVVMVVVGVGGMVTTVKVKLPAGSEIWRDELGITAQVGCGLCGICI